MNQPQAPIPRIAMISSSWHRELVDQATNAFIREVGARGHVDRFEVPGAFEIPLHAQRLARAGAHDAIVACGLVVDGGIYRHEFVASAVIDGLMRVQLDSGVPVLSVVLTPQHFHEHETHQQFFSDHLVHKGQEAAQACLRTVAGLRALDAAAR